MTLEERRKEKETPMQKISLYRVHKETNPDLIHPSDDRKKNSFKQIPFHSNKVLESKVRSNNNRSTPHVNAVETQRQPDWYSIHATQVKMTVKIHLLLEQELESRKTQDLSQEKKSAQDA